MARSIVGEEVRLEAEPPRPKAVLQLAENQAIEIAKFLQEHRTKFKASGGAASVEDALQIADIIAALSSIGRQCNAEQVIDIVSRVEILLDLLNTIVDSLLVSPE